MLAVKMVPVAFVIYALDQLRKSDGLYPKLGFRANVAVIAFYAGVCGFIAAYMALEFTDIRITRLGTWNTLDLLVGGLGFLLVMEYARKRHFPLFIVNWLLILYVLYGRFIPGLFWHPGMSWKRVLTAMSLEISTGIYSRLPQLALTLIGAFILVLSLLRGFGCISSLLKGTLRLGTKSPFVIPQTAVIGSMMVASVSGSGAANAATTGSATIPMMIQAGFSRLRAATIETAASIGGQLMPPVMGIAAFLMADFLGRSYFDVVARGFAPAFVYYIGVGFAVYLVTARELRRRRGKGLTEIGAQPSALDGYDKLNLLVYGLIIAALLFLMGAKRWPAMSAARTTFIGAGIFLSAVHIFRHFHKGLHKAGAGQLRNFIKPFLEFLETFSSMTADLTLLLAVLSILTAAFTITGVPTKVGTLLMNVAGKNLALLAIIALFFGYLTGLGLPPAPTYIVTAVVIVPPMVRAGISPWVAHFYAFFLGVFSELSPPTSVTAAVASRIANSSFNRTMIAAMGICAPLIVLMGVIFVRPALVVTPGLAQVLTMLLVIVGTLGVISGLYGTFSTRRTIDLAIRIFVFLLGLIVLFLPNVFLSGILAAPLAALVLLGARRAHRAINFLGNSM